MKEDRGIGVFMTIVFMMSLGLAIQSGCVWYLAYLPVTCLFVWIWGMLPGKALTEEEQDYIDSW